MSLSAKSNTINALGIFGRLTAEQEQAFARLEERYSKKLADDELNGFFPHLSVVIKRDVPVNEVASYLDLLGELKRFLPFRIPVSDVLIIEDKHLALSFAIEETEEIRKVAGKFFTEGVIPTFYIKVVWFVPKENQEAVKQELEKVKEIIFHDFILVANKQDDEHTLYSSNRYK